MPRELKNAAESQFEQKMIADGWEVTKRGWPDFICFRDGEIMCVEVKPARLHPLKTEQLRMLQLLSAAGIRCFKWSPPGVFDQVEPTSPRRPLLKGSVTNGRITSKHRRTNCRKPGCLLRHYDIERKL